MIQSQLDEINRKVGNMEIVIQLDTPDMEEQEKDELLQLYRSGYKVIESFYEKHKEIRPTNAECQDGIKYLNTIYERMQIADEVSETLLIWFIESYGEEPEKELSNNKAYTRLKQLKQSMDMSFDSGHDDSGYNK
jgi:hypothetical protein